jgi:hypothetical protein
LTIQQARRATHFEEHDGALITGKVQLSDKKDFSRFNIFVTFTPLSNRQAF